VIQGTFGVIQGTFDVIQGTRGVHGNKQTCDYVRVFHKDNIGVLTEKDVPGEACDIYDSKIVKKVKNSKKSKKRQYYKSCHCRTPQ
jgi:hypothetical protein